MNQEKLKKITLVIIGVGCEVKAIFTFGSAGAGGMGEVILNVALAAVWAAWGGICFALVWTPMAADKFVDLFYWKREYLKAPPEKISRIKGLIKREQCDEAIAEIEELLKRKPFLPEPYLLLVEIYEKNVGGKQRASELIEAYFRHSEIREAPENVEMLMLYADICREQNRNADAIFLLQHELNKRYYSVPEKNLLHNRLDAIL
ncbi:MAG: hypothetical protein WC071_14440 [Victivallaceae bacterium]